MTFASLQPTLSVEACATKVSTNALVACRSHVGFRLAVPAFSLCFNVAFAPDAWGWRCEGSDGSCESLSRQFYRSKVVFQSKQLDIPAAVSSRFPKGKHRLWAFC